MNMLKWILMIFLCLFIVIIAVQNHPAFSTAVTFKIDLLVYHWETRPLTLYVITTLAFSIGVIVTGIYSLIDRFSLKREIRRLRKSLAAKEKELNSLRNLPITEDVIEKKPEEVKTVATA